MASRTLRGCSLGILTGIMWACSSPISRYLSQRLTASPIVMLNFVRILITTILIGAFLLIYKRDAFRLPLASAFHFLWLSLVVTLGLYYGFAMSVVYMPVAIALVLHYTFPLLVTVLGAVFLRERPRWSDWVGAVMILLGVLISSLEGSWCQNTSMAIKGFAWGLLSALGMALQTLGSRSVMKKAQCSSLTMLFYVHLFGIFWVGLFAVSQGEFDLVDVELVEWGLVAVQALVASALAYASYAMAMKYIRASTASMMCSLEIVAAVGIAWFFLGEPPKAGQVLGCAFVMGAILVSGLAQMWRESHSRQLAK